MFKALPLCALAGHNFIPQAIVNRPISQFAKQLQAPIHRGQDDLDEYEAIAVEADNGLIFVLKHYPGYPDNTTTIYLPDETKSVDGIMEVLTIVMHGLHIPLTSVLWKRSDNPEL